MTVMKICIESYSDSLKIVIQSLRLDGLDALNSFGLRLVYFLFFMHIQVIGVT